MSTTTNTPHSGDLRPWSPWRDLTPWGRQFDELVDQLWSGFPVPADMTPPGSLHEEDDAYVVELDLPGIDKKDVRIDIADRRLTVTGTRVETERKGFVRHSTRVTGSFSYGALLPSPIDEGAVSATMADGVLTIRLPKATGTAGRHIEIA